MEESIQFKTYQETLRAKNAHSCNALLSRLMKFHDEAVSKPSPVIIIDPIAEPLMVPEIEPEADLVDPRRLRFIETPSVAPSVHEIKLCVCQHFKVSPKDLESPRKNAKIVLPRQVAFYLARKLTSRSFPEIGRKFGNRDHSTILHGAKKIAERMETDPQLATTVRCLEEQLA